MTDVWKEIFEKAQQKTAPEPERVKPENAIVPTPTNSLLVPPSGIYHVITAPTWRPAHTDTLIRVFNIGKSAILPGSLQALPLPRVGWLLELWAFATVPLQSIELRWNKVCIPISLPEQPAGHWIRLWHDTKAIRAAILEQPMPKWALLQDSSAMTEILYTEILYKIGDIPYNNSDFFQAYMIVRELEPDRVT